MPKYILGLVSVITVISYILNSKVIQQYQIELFRIQVDLPDINQQRGRQTRPKHHTYIDHVYLDRLFLLSNLTIYYNFGTTITEANGCNAKESKTPYVA